MVGFSAVVSGLEILGLVGEAISLVPTIADFLAPNPSTGQKTSVRIAMGHSNEDDSLGGNTPGVSLWDVAGKAIGFAPGKKQIVRPGAHVDVEITPREELGNVPAQYVSITNGGDDAICISGLAVTFPGGGQSGFSTDLATFCGALWSNSNAPILGQPADAVTPTPKCIWIDRDGSNGIPHQGIGIHLPSFANANKNLGQSFTTDKRLMCSTPRLHMYPQLISEDPILVFPGDVEFKTRADTDDEKQIGTDKNPESVIDNPGKLSERFKKKDLLDIVFDPITPGSSKVGKGSDTDKTNSTQPRRRPLAERVIVSPNTFNSARELCESDSSFGPSFVSLPEGLFCDMADKSLYFVCNQQSGQQTDSCCYDVDDDSFVACQEGDTRPGITKQKSLLHRSGGATARKVRGTQILASGRSGRKYDHVQRW